MGNSINDKSNHCLSIKHSTSPLFSVVLDVAESDEGTYSCNLHHHYCHLYETVKIQLAITKTGRCGRQLGVPFCKGPGLATGVQCHQDFVGGACVLIHGRPCMLVSECQRRVVWMQGFAHAFSVAGSWHRCHKRLGKHRSQWCSLCCLQSDSMSFRSFIQCVYL